MTETALLKACRTLFGQEVNLNRDFLYYLQPTGAKLAYRNQVKVNHPDRFNNSPEHVKTRQAERFREIHDAYSLLKEYLDKKHLYRFPAIHQGASHQAPNRPYPATATQPRRTRPAKPFKRSAVPSILLEFGMFAYYQGKITYQDLIEALVWQRRQRPMLGVIAIKWGWLNDNQVKRILHHRGQAQRFGMKALELGLLSQLQVDTLLRHQRGRQEQIGQYFVAKSLITAEEAERLAHHLKTHNQRVRAQDHRYTARQR